MRLATKIIIFFYINARNLLIFYIKFFLFFLYKRNVDKIRRNFVASILKFTEFKRCITSMKLL